MCGLAEGAQRSSAFGGRNAPRLRDPGGQLGLKIPNLRRMMREGVYAEGVNGVVPTITYPSHTTLITGVWPSKHGIWANTTFDPEQKNLQGLYWYSEDIKVPTLWDAANAAGLITASVNWPVSVGAPVRYLIPEVWRAGTADDSKLLRALSTPGLLANLEAELGPYADGSNADLQNDRLRATFATAIIKKYKPNLITVHLVALDPRGTSARTVQSGGKRSSGSL